MPRSPICGLQWENLIVAIKGGGPAHNGPHFFCLTFCHLAPCFINLRFLFLLFVKNKVYLLYCAVRYLLTGDPVYH